MILNDMIRLGAERHADRIAVRFAADELRFAEVDALSTGMAARLVDRLPSGAPVGILANNGLLSLPLDFACAKARLVRVPLNARLTAAEHGAMLGRLDVRLLIFSADLAERAGDLATALPGLDTLPIEVLANGAAG